MLEAKIPGGKLLLKKGLFLLKGYLFYGWHLICIINGDPCQKKYYF
jgi:hypothetical protein